MKKKLENLLSALVVLLLLPLIITIFMQKIELEKLMGSQEESKKNGNAETVEDLLPGILAKEISCNTEPEAIKAQCVIARTNCYLARETGGSMPESLSVAEMETLWGQDKFNEMYQKLEQYVQQTQNEILQYQGKTINAEYHAISAGQTRTIAEAVGVDEMPYLTSVDCKEDISAKGYLGVYDFSEEAFLKKCETAESLSEVQITARDTAGYVLTVQLGQREVSGEEFRALFTLPSANFTITQEKKNVRIITKGVGHGYGLSQNKAIHLAASGETYRQILTYFYPGTQLVTTQ